MPSRMGISDVHVRRPTRPGKGVVAWASCVVSGIKLDSIVVRRVGSGALVLGFPGRHSRSGGKHLYFEPTTEEAKRALEDAILGELHTHRARTRGKRTRDKEGLERA